MASNRKYASLLGKLRQEESLQPDADLKVFQAEALMILLCTPDEWHFYESRGDSAPAVARPETLESTKLLQEALIATNQTHAYAQHMLCLHLQPSSFLFSVVLHRNAFGCRQSSYSQDCTAQDT